MRSYDSRYVVGKTVDDSSKVKLIGLLGELFESKVLDDLDADVNEAINVPIEPLLNDAPMVDPGEYEPEPLPQWRRYDPIDDIEPLLNDEPMVDAGVSEPESLPVWRQYHPEEAIEQPPVEENAKAEEKPEVKEQKLPPRDYGLDEAPSDDEMNQGFSETPEETWWRELQDLLDENGCELDLSVPADRARLVVFGEISGNDDVGWTITEQFACDPEKRPIDIATITKEEILERQQVEPDQQTLEYLMEAAKDGRLFVRPLVGGKVAQKQRQIRTNENGETYLSEEIDHTSDEEERYAGVSSKPVDPRKKRPSAWDQIKAFFGNRAAQAKIRAYKWAYPTEASYNDALVRYRQKMIRWNEARRLAEEEPLYSRQVNNFFNVCGAYFNSGEMSEEQYTFANIISELHEEYLFEQMSPSEQAATLDLKAGIDRVQMTAIDFTEKASLLRNGDTVSPELKESLARLALALKLKDDAERALADKTTESFVPTDNDRFEKMLKHYKATPEYRAFMDELKSKDLMKLKNEYDVDKIPKRVQEIIKAVTDRKAGKNQAKAKNENAKSQDEKKQELGSVLEK